MANKKKRRGTPPPKDETKEQRFARVCTLRANKAVKAISNIAHCAGASYSYTQEQVSQLNTVLTKSLNNTIDALNKKEAKATEFKFTSPE